MFYSLNGGPAFSNFENATYQLGLEMDTAVYIYITLIMMRKLPYLGFIKTPWPMYTAQWSIKEASKSWWPERVRFIWTFESPGKAG